MLSSFSFIKEIKWSIFLITWACYLSFYFTRKNFSISKSTLETEYGLSIIQLGLISTAFLFLYTIGQFYSGWASDKYKVHHVLSIGCAGTGLMSIAFGLSDVFILLFIFFALNGLFQSTGWPCNFKLVSFIIPTTSRAKSLGLWSTNYQIGGAVATLLATTLLVNYGWRSSFIIPGILLMIWGVIIFKVKAVSSEHPVQINYMPPLGIVFRKRAYLLGGFYFFIKYFRYTLLFWLPYYLNTEHGLSLAHSAWTSLSFEIGGFSGVILLGWICDGFFKNNKSKVLPFGFAAMVCLFYFFSQNNSSEINILIPFIFFMGFLIFSIDTLMVSTLCLDIGGPELAGRVTGIVNGIGSLGATLSGIASSWVAYQYGWSSVFSCFAWITFAMMLLMLFSSRFFVSNQVNHQ